MRKILLALLWIAAPILSAQDHPAEARFISLLHKLQYAESYEDLKKLVPEAPAPQPYAGDDNTQVILKTRLFGQAAEASFSFHKNVLVSQGVTMKTPTYQDAHRVFLSAAKVLNEQVEELTKEAALPFPLKGEEGSDGPPDEIGFYINGKKGKAWLQISLKLRNESATVSWGGQKSAE